MKIKIDFITNSSSCNFSIPKIHLSEKQVLMIHSHIEIAKAITEKSEFKTSYGQDIYFDEWKITETEDEIKGYTSMDNFDMEWFFGQIGVDMKYVDWDHSNDRF